jgi:hypothetical protein
VGNLSRCQEHPILSRVESMSAAEVGDPRRGHFTGCRNQPPVLVETRLAPRRFGRVSRKEKAPASIGALPYAITERSPRANLSGSRGDELVKTPRRCLGSPEAVRIKKGHWPNLRPPWGVVSVMRSLCGLNPKNAVYKHSLASV